MKNLILIFIILLITSCKKGNSIIKDNNFKVLLEAKVLEDDKMTLYYVVEEKKRSFNETEKVLLNVNNSKQFQTLEFNLPKGVIPSKFRIDLGDNGNKNQTQVYINSITIRLNDNWIFIDKTLLDSFFEPNIYLEKNEDGYLRREVNNKYDPFILSKPVLNKKIEIEL